MNTSMSRDLSWNARRKYNIRNKNRHGYFHNTHNFNVINRNGSFQPNSVGFSEYVLHNPNTRPHTRLSATRPNAGYLNHISSQSIRKEKDYSAIGGYEEYTLRKIRTTSDMIKQQLMSPEHPIVSSENEYDTKSDEVTSKLKKRQSRSGGTSSTLSGSNKDNSSSKLIKKQSRSEEVTRLQQLKERRKNELREKFKKDKIASQKTPEIYNVKDISDKILQHISKMNNARLADFVNSDNSRYEEAFNYICKQKTFELTKALRDLSHQEKPEECEMVNAIIPEFSIKIEELPISVIRELSSAFDELHKDILDPLLSGDNLYQKSNDSSGFMRQTCRNNLQNGNVLNLQNEEHSQSATNTTIEILDSDEEHLPVKLENENQTLLPDQHESDDTRIEQVSLNSDGFMVSSSQKYANLSTGTNDTFLCQNKDSTCTNLDTQNLQSSSSIAKVLANSLTSEENSIGETNTPTSHSRGDDQTIVEETADSTPQLSSEGVEEKPYVEIELEEPSIQREIEEKPLVEIELGEPSIQMKIEEEPSIEVKTNNPNSKPKIGSVWVSKSIFATSDSLQEEKNLGVAEINNSHFDTLENSIPLENANHTSDGPASSSFAEKIAQSSAENVNDLNDRMDIDLAQRQEDNIRNTSNSDSSILPSIGSKDDHLSLNVSVTETNENHTQKDTSSVETIRNTKEARECETYPNVPNIDGSLESMHKFVPSSGRTQATSKSNSTIPSEIDDKPEKNFLSLTIKRFEKPKNLSDAVKIMKLIDEKIEILTKLRQDIFFGLSENLTEKVVPPKETNPGSKKRKLDDSVSGEVSERRKTLIPEKPPEEIKPFSNLDTNNEVILFCKIMHDEEECILGTDTGKIQYHSIFGKKPSMTVTIGYSAISFLECMKIYGRNYICTGTHTEFKLIILKYKRQRIENRVRLEDSIEALSNDWGFFFIGGKRGYLTRYDFKKNRIQYEDRISSSRIKDLRTSKEGPRKILVIFFEDDDGVAHIHVRDALTALHIRTIIDMKNVRCMYLRYSSVYLVTDGHIGVYNGTNGDFVQSVITNKQFFSMKSKGNLLILAAADGIYAFNMRTNHYLGCLHEENAVSSVTIYDQKIVLTTWEKKFVIVEIPDHFKAIM